MTRRDETLREFVRAQNVLAFSTQLQVENDPVRRRLLLTLLSEHAAAEPYRAGAALNP